MTKNFVIVAWTEAVPLHLSPRGQRAHHLAAALAAHGQVETVGSGIPAWLEGDKTRTTSSRPRRIGRRLLHSVLIDKYEPAARKRLWNWQPAADAAVLVGYPFSPLPIASQHLAAAGIPYVVDVGDPWFLTNPRPQGGRLWRRRSARQERRLWSSAAAAIVTTARQGEELRTLFPHLQVLVRPNGFQPPAADAAGPPAGRRSEGEELRLVHYGSLYGERVDFERTFRLLAESRRWRRITLRQHGPDWSGMLDSIASFVAVERRPAIGWDEVLGEAHDYDAAVVIGWRYPGQLPSKAIQYLTLPIPRLAITTAAGDDALAAYVRDKRGWAAVEDTAANPAGPVAELITRGWSDAELAPPASESWSQIERTLAAFVDTVTSEPKK